jgi:hypothetical protein
MRPSGHCDLAFAELKAVADGAAIVGKELTGA